MLISSRQRQVFVNRQMQRGLSLIEMMISITIGLIILSAMATLFSNQSKVRSELDKSNRMIDNGRYALELLTDNIGMAGFYGNYEPASGVPAATPDPCDLAVLTNAASSVDMLRHPVQGFDAATSAVGATGVSVACTAYAAIAGNNVTPKNGSDMLVMRRASTTAPVAAATVTAAASTVLQVSNCTNDVAPGYQIALGNAAFTLRDKDCTAVASLRPFIVQIYFVSTNNNVVGGVGDGIPTLKRIELSQGGGLVTTPLVEGVEYMQVEYGVDGDSDGDGTVDMAVFDGAPDSYVQTCPNATCWSRVVSVKTHIVARNIDPTTGYNDTKTYVLGGAGNFGPFNDAYKRHAYTKVVRLVNPSGRLAP